MGNVPLDLMMLPLYQIKRHSGTDFFSSSSQFFCTNYTRGTCHYGSACNQRHEPYAEVCCADYLVGTCTNIQCELYHRNPEGEALSYLSRMIPREEFDNAVKEGRQVCYWPEQKNQLVWPLEAQRRRQDFRQTRTGPLPQDRLQLRHTQYRHTMAPSATTQHQSRTLPAGTAAPTL